MKDTEELEIINDLEKICIYYEKAKHPENKVPYKAKCKQCPGYDKKCLHYTPPSHLN